MRARVSKIQLNIRRKGQAESLGDLRNQVVYLRHLIYENQNATNSNYSESLFFHVKIILVCRKPNLYAENIFT